MHSTYVSNFGIWFPSVQFASHIPSKKKNCITHTASFSYILPINQVLQLHIESQNHVTSNEATCNCHKFDFLVFFVDIS